MSDKQDVKRKKVEEESANKGALSKQQLSVRAYLDQTVVPALLTGMTHMAKLRPEDQDPVAWLGQWLIDYSKNKTTPLASPADKSASKQKADKPASANKEEKSEKSSPKSEKPSLAATTTTTTTTTTSSAPEATESSSTEQPEMEVEEQKPAAEESSTNAAASEEAPQ